MTTKEFEDKKQNIRAGLTILLRENFRGLGSYVSFLEKKARKINYLEREVGEEFIQDVRRDSYHIIGAMKRTGSFSGRELKRFEREYSELDNITGILRQILRHEAKRVGGYSQ